MALRISVLCIGRPDGRYQPAVDELVRMTGAWAVMEVRHLRPTAATDGSPAALRHEADRLRAALPERSYAVALSPEGRTRDTPGFARWLGERGRDGRPLVFLVGGAWGLDRELKAECAEVVSLSSLTMSHGVALVVLVEQVYRALTILVGHPYHK